MRYKDNIRELIKLDINFIGFIFYPQSPRFALDYLSHSLMAELPPHIMKTGVFVDEQSDKILETAKTFMLDAIQLHGNESVAMCRKIRDSGYKTIKAFHLSGEDSLKKLHAYEGYCDYFLFDTPTKNYGGSGLKFDWSIIEKYKGKSSFFLSGGIGPNDANSIFELKNPRLAAIDINSKFEVEPGLKDIDEIKKFIYQLRNNNRD